jgi:hypothetical protein
MGLRDAAKQIRRIRRPGARLHEWDCATPQSESKGFAGQERGSRMGLRDAAKQIRRIRRLAAREFANFETLRGRSQDRIVRQRRA